MTRLWGLTWLYFVLIAGTVVAAQTQTYTKEGDAFSSTSGNYATASHCSGSCGWVASGDVIVGVYNTNPVTWGGSVTYTFDLSSFDVDAITDASLTVRRVAGFGKGLHSTSNNGVGTVKVNDDTVGSFTTNVSTCGNDHFAHGCGVNQLMMKISPGSLSMSTNIEVGTSSSTAWDVEELVLVVSSKNRTIKIENNQISIEGVPFFIKGVDYAPWIDGSGPDPNNQAAFPSQFADVSTLVGSDVADVSGDGVIQTWEVIQSDLELMHRLGINTIRTYASGEWHDKDLDGVIDTGGSHEAEEIVQGDVPNWMHDQIIDFAEDQDMKVVLGYWVQEEDFEDEDISTEGYQLKADANDLRVAKDTLSRVVDLYSNSTAVIAWGIGNEVQGSFNHGWFDWSVDIVGYLNSLFTHVRERDPIARPIMYAKFIGENANFNNMDVDIIAVNAFTFAAQDLIDRGEFSLAAPLDKAYVLGEFGHIISQASGHWNLSLEHAGGFFLEFNDVWWKGNGQDAMGLVTKKRAQRADRYSELFGLFNTARVFRLPLKSGWNLVSFPLTLRNNSIAHVFRGVNFSYLYSLNPLEYYFASGSHNTFVVNTSRSYWIKSEGEQEVLLEGTGPRLVRPHGMWGFGSLNVSLPSAHANGSVRIFGYNSSGWYSYFQNKPSGLRRLRTLIPGRGYLVS